MKKTLHSFYGPYPTDPRAVLAMAALVLLLGAASASAANISKTDNSGDLSLGTSWVGGAAPGIDDIGQFDATILSGPVFPNLGADTNWLGLKMTSPAGAVTIGNSPMATLTLGPSGIDMSSATADLTLQCGLTLGGGQRWNVAAPRTLDASTVTLARSGKSTVDFSTTGTIKIMNALSGGIVGPWATCGGDDWATGAAGAAVRALPAGSYVSDFLDGNNTAVSTADPLAGALITGTLKTTASFDSATDCTLTVGGVLVPTGVTNGFSALALQAPPDGELVIQGGGRLALGAGIAANGTSSLTKSGNGTLILTNASAYKGGTTLNAGTLVIAGNSTAIFGTIDGKNAFNIYGGALDCLGGNRAPTPGGSSTAAIYGGDFTFLGSGGNLTLPQQAVTLGRDITITVANGTLSSPRTMGGPFGFTKAGAGTYIMNRLGDMNGIIHVKEGTLSLQNSTGSGTGTKVGWNIRYCTLDMQGGSVIFTSAATNHTVTGLTGSGTIDFSKSSGAIILNVRCDRNTTFPGALIGANGGLMLTHNGRLTLTGQNTYSGNTDICLDDAWSAGVPDTTNVVLALSGSGSIASSNIFMGHVYTNNFAGGNGDGTPNYGFVPVQSRQGAVFDVSGVTGGSYSLINGQTLWGNGAVNGTLVVGAGATVAPGPVSVYDATLMGTQYYSNAPTLLGTVALRLYKSGSTLANDKVVVVPGGGVLHYGGTLKVTASGDVLSAGDKFYLFAADSFSGVFATNLPALVPGLFWKTNNLTIDGSIEIVSASCVSPLAIVSGSVTITAGDSTTIQADLTGTPPWNIAWSDGLHQNGLLTSPATRSVSPTSTTTYTVTNVTDSGPCPDGVGIQSAVVTVNAGPLDHFTIVPSFPTALGQPFTVTVTAQDRYGNTELADSSTGVMLSSTLSGIAFDSSYKSLTSGVATFTALDNLVESGTITADDFAGHVNVSGLVSITSTAAGEYQSAASGSWSLPATWQTFNGTQWVAAATAPTSANGAITIRSPHQVTIDAATTVDQVVVNAGAQLLVGSGQTATLNSSLTSLSSDYAVVAQTPRPPVINGTVDAIWSRAYSTPVTHVCSQVPNGIYTNASQCSGSFKTLYDADYLYVLVQVTDDRTDHTTDSSTALHLNNAVEIYVDANNTKTTTYQFSDFHFGFSLVHGTTLMMSESHNNTNGVLVGWVETGTNANYVMEVAIPWSLVGQWPVAPGALLGFDVQIDHAYKGGTRDFDLFWHGTNDTDYLNPTQFGVAILKSGAAADLDVFGGLRNSGTINGAGSLAVESGGQLSGTGVINNGNGTLAQSGAGLLPGSAGLAGTLTFGGTLTFDTNATPAFDLSGNAGSGNDKVVLTGSGTVAGNGAVVTINPLTTLAVANYVLFDVQGAGSVSSDFNATPAWSGTPPVNAADYSIITSGRQVLLHNVAAPTPPTFDPPVMSGGNLILSGRGGTPNAAYSVVTSTDPALPLSSWTPVSGQSGHFGGDGRFSNTIPVGGSDSKRFYSIRSP